MQITHLQSVRMSFENVNFAKFKNVFEIKFPKLLISYEMKLSNFYFVQITHLQSVRMSFENVNFAKFKNVFEIKFPKLLISYEMNLVTFILCKLHICKVFECLLKMLTLQNLKMSLK